MAKDMVTADNRSDFIEKVGLITQAEGLPRIAGRIFGMLVFDGETVSFSDLADRLEVSRASVSTSMRLLEERSLIKRVAKPGERQDFFQLAPNAYPTMIEGTIKRMQAAKDEILETLDTLPKSSGAHQRLSEYAGFYRSIEAGLDTALDTIKQTNS